MEKDPIIEAGGTYIGTSYGVKVYSASTKQEAYKAYLPTASAKKAITTVMVWASSVATTANRMSSHNFGYKNLITTDEYLEQLEPLLEWSHKPPAYIMLENRYPLGNSQSNSADPAIDAMIIEEENDSEPSSEHSFTFPYNTGVQSGPAEVIPGRYSESVRIPLGVCPDCNGTKEVILFMSKEPCKTCQ